MSLSGEKQKKSNKSNTNPFAGENSWGSETRQDRSGAQNLDLLTGDIQDLDSGFKSWFQTELQRPPAPEKPQNRVHADTWANLGHESKEHENFSPLGSGVSLLNGESVKPPLSTAQTGTHTRTSSNPGFFKARHAKSTYASPPLTPLQPQAPGLKPHASHEPPSLLGVNFPAVPSMMRHSDPFPRRQNELPGGTPPAASPAIPEVDGVSHKQLEQWFQEAGPGHDGILEPSKAASFFARSGLARGQLSQVWNACKVHFQSGNATTKGLNRAQFAVALRLIALAQTGRELSDRLMSQAITARTWEAHGNLRLPAPRIDDPKDQMRRRLEVATAQPPIVPHSAPNSTEAKTKLQKLAEFETMFGLGASPWQPLEDERQPSGALSPTLAKVPALDSANQVPVCFEARLPPLHPKRTANLQFLAAGGGSLFSGPSTFGGILQWMNPEDEMEVRTRIPSCINEDDDAAKAAEIRVTPNKHITCLHVDQTRQLLWVGHAGGRVSAYSLLDSARHLDNKDRVLAELQAHKSGRVTAICTTAYGDLWTGNSRGVIRVRRFIVNGGKIAVEEVRELRRQGGLKASTHAILNLVAPTCGQVVWSATSRSMYIWEALTGQYLGSMRRASEGTTEKPQYVPRVENSERDHRYIPRPPIDSSKGLELDSKGRAVTSVKGHPLMSKADFVAMQKEWAAHTDKKSTEWVDNMNALGEKAMDNAGKAYGKCVKSMNKWGGKLMRGKNSKGESPPNVEQSSMSSNFGKVGLSRSSVELGSENASDEEAEYQETEGKSDKKEHSLTHIVAGLNNTVWVCWNKGRVDRYSFAGKLEMRKELGTRVCCMAAVGLGVWFGLVDGRIRVMNGGRVREWRAHEAGIIGLVHCGSRVYSLAADGSINGWCSTSPTEHDAVARQKLDNDLASMTELRHHEILCLTWNVNEVKPVDHFFQTVSRRAVQGRAGVAVFALQEIEMGGSSLAMGVAKEKLQKKAQEKGNNNGQWWAKNLHNALGVQEWKQFGLRQLSGMVIIVFAKTALQGVIGEVSSASVACGVLGVAGNKGAVAVSFTLNRRRVACVCSHFAAHQGGLANRRQNYQTIVKNLTFSKLPQHDVTVMLDEGENSKDKKLFINENSSESDSEEEKERDIQLFQGQGMRSAEVLVWLGDFNYRVNMNYEDTIDFIKNNWLDKLLEKDQCRLEMRSGYVFQHLREGDIDFPPTYKFDKGDSSPHAYDSSEKKRVPSWTDRIFFRGSKCDHAEEDTNSGFDPAKNQRADAVTVEAIEYTTDLTVTDSDHKPVWSKLAVDLPVVIQDKKRKKCSELLKRCYQESQPEQPRTSATQKMLFIQSSAPELTRLRITNDGNTHAAIQIISDVESKEEPAESIDIPEWLVAFPAAATIAPKSFVDVWFTTSNTTTRQVPFERRAPMVLLSENPYSVGGLQSSVKRHHFWVEDSAHIGEMSTPKFSMRSN